ncbi:MAG: YihY/virulence factor BrkB family protein [Chloroflexi bacterium]|nr:YihY/virulence factor BrkB family protein [Chloroflexota bacterium]MDA1240857.1 YihY/virulence factor BrkB family protein [Chloroflexota bacterium]
MTSTPTSAPTPPGSPARPSIPWWRDWRLPLKLLGRAAGNFSADRGTFMAAAISYYTLFSLFPLTLLAVAIFGIVIRDDVVQTRVLNSIIEFLPIEDSSIEESLRRVADLGPTLTVVSAFGSLWTAGALSAAVRSALNIAFDATRPRPMLRGKLIDYLLVPILGLPLIGGIVLTGVWRFAQQELADRWNFLDGRFSWTWEVGAILIPLVLTFLAFLLAYWLVPNRRLSFRYLWPGALVAALGFETLKAGFTWYLANFGNYDVIYGSIGSVIILLFWVFVSANILIFGAEIAAEVPLILRDRQHADEDDDSGDSDWRSGVLSFLRGLVMAGDEHEAVPSRPAGETARDRRRVARESRGR